jgi:hypothetical protein
MHFFWLVTTRTGWNHANILWYHVELIMGSLISSIVTFIRIPVSETAPSPLTISVKKCRKLFHDIFGGRDGNVYCIAARSQRLEADCQWLKILTNWGINTFQGHWDDFSIPTRSIFKFPRTRQSCTFIWRLSSRGMLIHNENTKSV